MVFNLPVSRIPEMAEVLVTMFDPEMTGTFKEIPPRKVVTSNVFGHLACEGMMARADSERGKSAPNPCAKSDG